MPTCGEQYGSRPPVSPASPAAAATLAAGQEAQELYLLLARLMRHPPARQGPDDQLRLPGHGGARRDGSLQRGPRVDDRLPPDDRARRGHGVAPDLDAIAEQGTELAQAGIQARAVRMADRYRSRHDLEVREPGPGAQVDVVPQDRLPDVSEVRRPGAIQQDRRLALAGVADHAVSAGENIAAQVGSMPHLGAGSDQGGAADVRARFHPGALGDLDVAGDAGSVLDLPADAGTQHRQQVLRQP